MKFKALYIILTTLILLSLSTTAATINAASCSHADVLAAYNSAANGDTVLVPPGSCTWNSGITLSKDVIIQGAGKTQTLITRSGACFLLDHRYNNRVTGFGFTNCIIISNREHPVAGKAFRIDHNSFTANTWTQQDFSSGCGTPQIHVTGLIDSNTFHNYRIANTAGSTCLLHEGDSQHQLWAQTPPKGQSTGIIYIENNNISSTDGIHGNWADGSYGARYAGRFNNVNGNTYIEVHSIQGSNRAVQWWEFYKNTDTKSTVNWYPFMYIRGGSGFVWGNTVSDTHSRIQMNNVRSCRSAGSGGKCDGTSSWDQNTGTNGHACRDQIGRSHDTTLWNDITTGPYTQPADSAYFWQNVKQSGDQLQLSISSGENCPGGDFNNDHIQANRDYYTQNLAFDGTSGVGTGTLANRPATCTTGVGYWATDQGDWNTLEAGPDGQFYKCTSTNTWTLHYTPLQYPHPLTTQGFLADTPSGPDTIPPVLSNGAPSGTLPGGTTQTTLSVSTNEFATCKYSTTPNTNYNSMPNTFSTTGATSHSQTITGLTDETSYNYYIRCEDQSSNENTVDFIVSFSVAAPDTTPPTVSITSPSNQAEVSGTVTITAAASDNVGVSGVQFKVNGNNQGSQDTTSPYSISWNTASLTNGSYTLTAETIDTSGNTATSTSITVTVANVPVDISSGLVGYWKLDETSGSTASDSSGNSNDGTLQGGTWTTGQVNNALDFDGNDDYVDLNNLDVSGNELTIAAWIKSDNLGNCGVSDCRIISKATGVQEQDHYWMLSTISSSEIRPRFRLKTGGSTSTLIGSTTLSNNEWYHIIATYDGSEMKLYIDGVASGAAPKTGNLDTDNAVNSWIGNNPSGARPWDGQIDEVRIYNRALYQTEVTQLYQYTGVTPPNPPPPAQIPGDVNNDGVVDVLDLLFVVQEVGKQNFNPVTDVNSDSAVNILDLVWIVNRMN